MDCVVADNDKVPDGRTEPRCTAWQTWQVVSCCPFWWVWVAVWVRNTTNSTARVRVNTLVHFPMVFPLKAIALCILHRLPDWTRRRRRSNRSKQPLNPSRVCRHVPNLLYSWIVSWNEAGAMDGSYQLRIKRNSSTGSTELKDNSMGSLEKPGHKVTLAPIKAA